MTSKDTFWMKLALEEAKLAMEEGEIPVGAVLIKDDKLVLRNHNRTKQLRNPLAHAEKLLIDEIITDNSYVYLNGYTLYVTLEPCIMCAGVLLWSRVGTVVFGASDEKAGAVGSIYDVLRNKSFNHHPKIVKGVLETECSEILTEFFKSKR